MHASRELLAHSVVYVHTVQYSYDCNKTVRHAYSIKLM